MHAALTHVPPQVGARALAMVPLLRVGSKLCTIVDNATTIPKDGNQGLASPFSIRKI